MLEEIKSWIICGCMDKRTNMNRYVLMKYVRVKNDSLFARRNNCILMYVCMFSVVWVCVMCVLIDI